MSERHTRSYPPPCGEGRREAPGWGSCGDPLTDPHPQPLPTRGRGAHRASGTSCTRTTKAAVDMTRMAVALLAGLLWTNVAQAQANDARWPERPIRLIVPFTAGSSSDIVARLVAQKLGERLGQPLVVENRVGGGGSIGSGEVAQAQADGYTLGLANTSTHAVAASLAPLSYDPVKDFAPISMLGQDR